MPPIQEYVKEAESIEDIDDELFHELLKLN
jgi:hypothetical protein